MGNVKLNEKPTAEDFAYAYAEDSTGATVRVPKEKIHTLETDDTLTQSGIPADAKAVGNKFGKLSEEIDNLATLPYGGSEEWLKANGDKTQLYQIDGYAWGYVESDGWTKSNTQFIVVSSESEMTNVGGTEYLLRNGGEGTVYTYTEASGDIDVPVFDSLPEAANEGDIVAVGGRKYKAVLTETEVPDYTNLADPTSSDWAEGYRFNSSGVLQEVDGFVATNYISAAYGDVIRVRGMDLDTHNYARLGTFKSDKAVISISKISGLSEAANATYDTTSAQFTVVGSIVKYLRFTAPLVETDDIIITVNEEIKNKTVTEIYWEDIGEYTVVEAGWSATEETYTVIDSLSASANNGDSAVYSVDGFLYSYIGGSGWMKMSKYNPPNIAVDSELSDDSTNAVQNKVVKGAIDEVKAQVTANESDILTLKNEIEGLGGGSTSSETVAIPSYWGAMITSKAEIVKALQEAGGKNCVSFAWAADTHIGDNDPGTDKGYSGGRSNDIGKLMAKMMDDCDVPFAVISGDIATRSSQPTEAEYLTMLANVPTYLAPLWNTYGLIMALGNHDGTWGDSTGYYRHQFTPERLWHTFFRGQALDFRRVFSDDGLYFYVDNIPQKMRYITLNSHFGGEYAEDENGWVVNNRFVTSCYGQAQLEWLANVALDLPEGYGAVINIHVPPKAINGSTTPYTVDYEQFNGIINAYCNKTTFSGSYTAGVDGWSNSSVSVDFTGANGEIIAVFAGHIHTDTVDTETLACPLITIIAAGAPVNTVNLAEGEVPPVRYPWGTDQETSFDIVTINRVTRKIYCTRVGAGSDREVSY